MPKVTQTIKGTQLLVTQKNHDCNHSERKEKERIKILFENTNSITSGLHASNQLEIKALYLLSGNILTHITHFDSSLNS